MIVTITINPAIDKSSTVDKLIPEKKLRCSDLLIDAGGGGINVSKAIKRLGGESLALFPAGGNNGETLKKLLTEEKILYKDFPVAEETRESFTVLEHVTNAQYRFVMPGLGLTEAEMEGFIQFMRSVKPFPEIIIASGSLAAGVPDDFYARLAKVTKQTGSKLLVDTSGIPLQLAVKEGVYLLKPNLSELGTLVGKTSLELDEVDDAARDLIKDGLCEVIVVSMGPEGAILVTKDIHERIAVPTVKKLTTVGAGDSMVAGMAWTLQQGKSLSEMVRFGVACGTAATMNSGTQLFKKDDVYKLYEWINKHNM